MSTINDKLKTEAYNHAVNRCKCVEEKHSNEQDVTAELCQRLAIILDRRKWRLSRREIFYDEAEETLLMQKLLNRMT